MSNWGKCGGETDSFKKIKKATESTWKEKKKPLIDKKSVTETIWEGSCLANAELI